jgi:hypothetical protein
LDSKIELSINRSGISKDFPELLDFILQEYQVEAKKTKALIGKEFVFIKRIADVIPQ